MVKSVTIFDGFCFHPKWYNRSRFCKTLIFQVDKLVFVFSSSASSSAERRAVSVLSLLVVGVPLGPRVQKNREQKYPLPVGCQNRKFPILASFRVETRCKIYSTLFRAGDPALETDQLMGRPTAKTVHKAWGRDRSLQIEQRDGVDYDGDEGEVGDVRGRRARTHPRAWEPRQAGDLLLPQEEASGQERKLLESTRGNQEGG